MRVALLTVAHLACAAAFAVPQHAKHIAAPVINRQPAPRMVGLQTATAWVGGTVIAGASGAVFVVKNLEPWYASIQKPAWSPPNNIFAPMWTMLYAMIGYSCARVFGGAPLAAATRKAFNLYAIQAVLNLSWAPIFFGLHKLRSGFFVSAAMLIFAALTAVEFGAISGAFSAALLVPYLLWLTFATTLNLRLWQLNGPTTEGGPAPGMKRDGTEFSPSDAGGWVAKPKAGAVAVAPRECDFSFATGPGTAEPPKPDDVSEFYENGVRVGSIVERQRLQTGSSPALPKEPLRRELAPYIKKPKAPPPP